MMEVVIGDIPCTYLFTLFEVRRWLHQMVMMMLLGWLVGWQELSNYSPVSGGKSNGIDEKDRHVVILSSPIVAKYFMPSHAQAQVHAM